MLIDCNQCAMQYTNACNDCVVTALFEIGPVELDEREMTALENLADEGLVPKLRLIPTDRKVS